VSHRFLLETKQRMIVEKNSYLWSSITIFYLLLRALLPVVFITPAVAQTKGYEVLSNPQPVANPERVEVVEFFWYGCPHCFEFESHINKWLDTKPDNVDFVTVAPPLNPAWKIHSQAFYAAQVMGILDKFHEPMFNAIHNDRKPMRKRKELIRLVNSLGLDGEKFAETMKSFNVDAKIRQSLQKAKDSGIASVPSVIVNGKYFTSGALAGSYPDLIGVINQLVEAESK